MATIQSVNNGDSGLVARTKINDNDANINAALEAAEALLLTDNPSLDDFQKITNAIEAIQSTLSVNDAAYDTLQKITDKLKVAETNIISLTTDKQNLNEKGIADGYASLNATGKVPASQLPASIDSVEEYANLAAFPATGTAGVIYVAQDTNLTYRWSGTIYVKLNDVDFTDYLSKITDTLDDVAAGTTNKHFTDTDKTKLANIADGAEVNVQSDWNETNNTDDAFINNKPTLGTASSKDVGAALGNIQENGAILGNLQTVETDATGKFITATKNTAYNANFGTGNTDVARGDASYLKADTYTQTEIDTALAANSTDDRARANHTGEQAIATVTGLQTALDSKEDTANKGQASGYAGLDSNAQVPLSQLPANAQGSKVVADIATRDVIANADRYEGLPVHVLDASADTTVTSGGAGYILKSGLANTDWEKTYESESLDIDLSDYFNKTTDTTDNITEGTAKFTTQGNIDKLAGIEANATADQTDAEIKTAYENNADTNAFTDAEKSNLANQSGTNTGDEVAATETIAGIAEIATQAEAEAGTDNTNKFLNALKAKQAFDAFLPQKFDTLFNGSVTGGSFSTSKTLAQIIADYKVIWVCFTTSIHNNAISIPTSDLSVSRSYEEGKFDTRYVLLAMPASLSSSTFTYISSNVLVTDIRIVAL